MENWRQDDPGGRYRNPTPTSPSIPDPAPGIRRTRSLRVSSAPPCNSTPANWTAAWPSFCLLLCLQRASGQAHSKLHFAASTGVPASNGTAWCPVGGRTCELRPAISCGTVRLSLLEPRQSHPDPVASASLDSSMGFVHAHWPCWNGTIVILELLEGFHVCSGRFH